jgi:hypothetical protein
MTKMSKIHQTIISNLPKLIKFQKDLNGGKNKWIFRGEQFNGKIKDSLKTSLEIAFDSINPSIKGAKLDKHKINAEKDVIREFQRKLHLYSDNLPTRADIIQWLSLMQHHGAPTRLLDWTYSFWVAVHFAVTKCEPGKEVAIWAVSVKDIVKKGEEFKGTTEMESLGESMENNHNPPYCDRDAIWDNAVVHHLIEVPKLRVYISSSFRRNERLTLQQGTFMITGDITKPFKKNLQNVAPMDDENYVRLGVIKVTHRFKKEIIKKLLEMNINNAVLFPGIDGFSESLWSRVSLLMEEKLLIKGKNLKLFP